VRIVRFTGGAISDDRLRRRQQRQCFALLEALTDRTDRTAAAPQTVEIDGAVGQPRRWTGWRRRTLHFLAERIYRTERRGRTAAAAAALPAREKRRSTKTKAEKRAQREAVKERRKAAPRPERERKPIVRLPKPEQPRANRKERRGVVISSAMDKTIVVRVDSAKPDRRYKKVVRRSVKFHAHDESSQAKVGDVVRIIETRPLSKTKRWRLAEVVEAAK